MFPNALMNQGAGSPAGDAVTPPGGELLHVFVSNMQKQTEIKCFFRPLTEKNSLFLLIICWLEQIVTFYLQPCLHEAPLPSDSRLSHS